MSGKEHSNFSSIDSVVAESGNPSYIGTTALWKAVASAKTGDTAQAEQLLSMYDTDDRFPDWYALLKRAEYCVFFHEFEAAKELLTESLAVAPNEPSVQLTYVELLATHFPHLHAEARATLSGFHRESSTELTSLFLDGLDGVVRLNEQQNQVARDELQGVVNNLTPLVRASPLLMATICKFQAFLVIAQARCVEADAAQRLYSQIKQFLVAHEMNDLVDRVEQELALTS